MQLHVLFLVYNALELHGSNDKFVVVKHEFQLHKNNRAIVFL